MSWDQQAYSFGNPNAQPPTPTKTPTSAQFPSPTFQTPRNNSSFEDRSGWTPTFAEEYSVFNSTPGRLTSTHHSFVDGPTPCPSTSVVQDRRLSKAGDIAAELATHVYHLSPNPTIPLPPVDRSNLLPSSPGANPAAQNRTLNTGRLHDSSKKTVIPRKPKKRLEEAFSGQTATPPASASKGSRKLAPKLSTETMQNDAQDRHYGTSQTPTQHHDLMTFPSTSADFFYPMSAPATAPVFTNTKPFWDPDTSIDGMDIDFNTDDLGMFNTGSHRVSNSFDWGRSNQIFQDTVNVPAPSQNEPKVASKRPRPLAPKLPVSTTELPASMAPFDFRSVHVSDDPFSAATLGDGVDPGLLFSGNNPVSMPSAFEDTAMPPVRPSTSHIELKPYSHQMRESQRDLEELHQSRSMRDHSKGRRLERGTASSPIRSSARPGLHRSMSDNRGKRAPDRIMPRTGRISPVKQQHPSSLMSIPELAPPKTRTEVKFTIDSKGRARAETVVVEDGEDVSLKRSRGGPSPLDEQFESDYESSTDEEPIILPSQNTSFALPQPKGPKLATFETSNRGLDVRRHSTSLSGYSQSESSSQRSSVRRDSIESEAETVMEENDGSGDATRALRKVMEDRKRNQLKSRNPRHHRYVSDATPRGNSQYVYSSSTNISPTTVTDPDGATPSSSRSGTTRCVCNKPDSEGMMIQCESCDNWLHAQCVGIDHRSLPPVYICAFCAQTPNMRGGRVREPTRGNGHVGSSPLAHKAFRSFR